ncbi:MAG: TonB-dependent receptor [Bacteroidales bacterium]|nr:TonB-dependent receptor [Bacteroidales bacterium]
MSRFILIILLLLSYFAVFGQNDSIDVYEYNLVDLSNLKVNSASKIEQKFNSVPATMYIISAEMIKERGYFTLDEALADLPGFQFRNIQGFNSYIFQRGITSQNNLILVLIDGIQINELNSGGFYGGGQYNLDNIERIDVLYGPASVVYGTNAVSGIVNIITKNNKGLQINALGGDFNTYYSNFNYGLKKNNLNFSISGMFKTSEKADLKEEKGDNNWSNNMENFEDDYSFDVKLIYKNFTFGSNFQNKQSSRTTNHKSIGTIYKDNSTLWNIVFLNSYVKSRFRLSPKIEFQSTFYNRNATVMSNSVYEVIDTTQIGYFRPNNLTGFENICSFSQKEKLNLVGGLVFEYEMLSENASFSYSNSSTEKPPVPERPNTLDNFLVSVFAEADYSIVSQLSVAGGLRYDYSSVYDQVLTPRFSLIFNDKQVLSKLLYAQAFRAPKPWDYTNGLGNPDLLPEKMRSVELSNSIYFSDNFVVLFSIYKNILNQAIVKQFIGSFGDFMWINEGLIQTDGIELGFKYKSKHVDLYSNYTFNSSYNENKVIIDEISKHALNSGFNLTVFKKIKLNLNSNFYSKKKNLQLIMTTSSWYVDPAIIFNGTVGVFDFHGFDLMFIVKNIFDIEYYHTSNKEVERYRQPQRTIFVKISYKMNKKRE